MQETLARTLPEGRMRINPHAHVVASFLTPDSAFAVGIIQDQRFIEAWRIGKAKDFKKKEFI